MSRDWRLRIEDILAAAERATRFVAEMDLATLRPTSAPRRQCSFSDRRGRESPARRDPQPRPRRCLGGDHRHAEHHRHGYFEVDLEVPWKTVRLDLPPLQQQMRSPLDSASPER